VAFPAIPLQLPAAPPAAGSGVCTAVAVGTCRTPRCHLECKATHLGLERLELQHEQLNSGRVAVMDALLRKCSRRVAGESGLFSPMDAPSSSATASKDILCRRAPAKKSEKLRNE
jgi:hypothetical protein